MALPNLIGGTAKEVCDAMKPNPPGRICILTGGFGEYGYNVITDGNGYVEVQFDIPKDHPLFGRVVTRIGEGCPFDKIITIHDEEGTTTWARIIFEKTSIRWDEVLMRALTGYDWLLDFEIRNRKNYIGDNGNGKSVT